MHSCPLSLAHTSIYSSKPSIEVSNPLKQKQINETREQLDFLWRRTAPIATTTTPHNRLQWDTPFSVILSAHKHYKVSSLCVLKNGKCDDRIDYEHMETHYMRNTVNCFVLFPCFHLFFSPFCYRILCCFCLWFVKSLNTLLGANLNDQLLQ